MAFEKFIGGNTEQYCFVGIPSFLFTNPAYKSLSTDAKLLYGLMLQRITSDQAQMDEQNRIFIEYPLPELMNDLNCGRNKAMKTQNALEAAGLIQRTRCRNKPCMIYVLDVSNLNFHDSQFENEIPESLKMGPQKTGNDLCEDFEAPNGGLKMKPQMFENQKNDSSTPIGCANEDLQEFKNQTSGVSKLNFPACACARADRLDNLNTNISIYQSINHHSKSTDTVGLTNSPDLDSDFQTAIVHETPGDYNVYFANQFDLNKRSQDSDYAEDVPLLAEVVSFCAELTSQCDHAATVHIGRRAFPSAEIKRRFMGLTTAELDYFMDCFSSVRTNVRNPKAYILTSLYNAPTTIASYQFRKRRRRKEVLPAYYYDSSIEPEQPDDGKPIDRAALMAEMRAAVA